MKKKSRPSKLKPPTPKIPITVESRLQSIFKKARGRISKGKPPTEPSDQFIRALSLVIRQNVHPDVACRTLGVSYHLFKTWFEKGLDDLLHAKKKSQYIKFVQSIDAADAQAEASSIQLITERIQGWQALAWIQERRNSGRWGAKVSGMLANIEDMLLAKSSSKALIDVDKASEVLAILTTYNALPSKESSIDLSTGEEEAQA